MPGSRANPDRPDADRHAAKRLDAYWDDLVRTGAADLSAPGDGDAARASVIAYIGLLTPSADPAARERIRRRLFVGPKETSMTAPSLPLPDLNANGHHRHTPLPWTQAPGARPRRGWHRPLGALELATTFALILATVGGILILRPSDDRPSLPAASSQLVAIATPEVSDPYRGEAGVEWEIPADDPIGTQLFRMTLGPDATWAYQNDGLIVFWVLEGRISVEGAVGGPQVHGPRGAAFFSGTGRTEVRPGGNAPAVVLVGVVYAEASGAGMIGENSEGQVETMLLARGSTTLPPGPAWVSISQVVVPLRDEAAFSSYPGNEVHLFGITSGALRMTRLAGQIEIVRDIAGAAGETGGWAEYRLGEAIEVMPGDGITAQPRSGYAVESVGPKDATLVGFSISSETRVDASVPGPRGDELVTVAWDACRVEPRSIESLRAIVSAATATMPVAAMAVTPEGESLVDEETANQIIATVRDALVCNRYGTSLQGYALFSDDAIRAAAANGLTLDDVETMAEMAATPVTSVIGPPGPDPFYAIDHLVRLPDGRVSGVVNADGEITRPTFVLDPESGRWLIDVWDDLLSPVPNSGD